jgi:hypothetical protein
MGRDEGALLRDGGDAAVRIGALNDSSWKKASSMGARSSTALASPAPATSLPWLRCQHSRTSPADGWDAPQ